MVRSYILLPVCRRRMIRFNFRVLPSPFLSGFVWTSEPPTVCNETIIASEREVVLWSFDPYKFASEIGQWLPWKTFCGMRTFMGFVSCWFCRPDLAVT